MSKLVVKQQEYKGYPTIAIYKDSEAEMPLVSFGVSKAKAILECIDEIEEFVLKNDKSARD